MALYLSEGDVRQLLTMEMAFDAVGSAHRDLAIQDLAVARRVLQAAEAYGIGAILSF